MPPEQDEAFVERGMLLWHEGKAYTVVRIEQEETASESSLVLHALNLKVRSHP